MWFVIVFNVWWWVINVWIMCIYLYECFEYFFQLIFYDTIKMQTTLDTQSQLYVSANRSNVFNLLFAICIGCWQNWNLSAIFFFNEWREIIDIWTFFLIIIWMRWVIIAIYFQIGIFNYLIFCVSAIIISIFIWFGNNVIRITFLCWLSVTSRSSPCLIRPPTM